MVDDSNKQIVRNVLYWLRWAKKRFKTKAPHQKVELADELWTVLQIADACSVDLPAIRRLFEAEKKEISKELGGFSSLTQGDVILRSKVVASVIYLSANDISIEDARDELVEIAKIERKKVVRWHQDLRDTPLPKPSTTSKEAPYIIRYDYQIDFFGHELKQKHNELTLVENVKRLFPQ